MKTKSEQKTNIIVRFKGLKPRQVWEQLAERQARRWRTLCSVASAQVTFIWQHGIKPAFKVMVWLEVPGPDFHAEATDHTAQAALLKVGREVERQIRSRNQRRTDKHKTNLQLGLKPARSVFGFSGARA